MKEYRFGEHDGDRFGSSKEFRDFVKTQPEVFELFRDLISDLVNEGDVKERSGMKVELFKLREGLKIMNVQLPSTPFYKVTVNGADYFVKRCTIGHQELEDTIDARDTLSTMSGVRVVEPIYGFTGKDGDSFYVTKWENLPLLEEALRLMPEDRASALTTRLNEVRKSLGPAYFDTRVGNAFYDETKDEIVLFDLNASQFIKKLAFPTDSNGDQPT